MVIVKNNHFDFWLITQLLRKTDILAPNQHQNWILRTQITRKTVFGVFLEYARFSEFNLTWMVIRKIFELCTSCKHLLQTPRNRFRQRLAANPYFKIRPRTRFFGLILEKVHTVCSIRKEPPSEKIRKLFYDPFK